MMIMLGKLSTYIDLIKKRYFKILTNIWKVLEIINVLLEWNMKKKQNSASKSLKQFIEYSVRLKNGKIKKIISNLKSPEIT